MVLNIYNRLLDSLNSGRESVLMVVISSDGSSPGRQGFLMMVTTDSMSGTIGGGIMEHKLVELSKDLLSSGRFEPFIRKQVHMAEAARDRSGMICSGKQVIAFYFFDGSNIETVNEIVNLRDACISYTERGVSTTNESIAKPGVHIKDDLHWTFIQSQKPCANVYIFGGGHTGLALCEVLSRLDFEIHLFDNRQGLNTMEINHYANTRQVIRYEDSSKYVTEGPQSYVVIMSFGYRTDEIILRSLYGMEFRYIGMLGSREKINTMREALLRESYSREYFDNIHAPIGLDIKSETVQEIAISIAAELIAAKNKKSIRREDGTGSND